VAAFGRKVGKGALDNVQVTPDELETVATYFSLVLSIPRFYSLASEAVQKGRAAKFIEKRKHSA